MELSTINNSINQALNIGIFNIFKTNNPVIDAIILSILGTLIATGINKLINLVPQISITSIYIYFFNVFTRIYNYITGKNEFIKQVTINSISDDRKTNELYDAMYWYLTNSDIVDFVKETPLKFNYDKKIHITDENIKLKKIMSKHKEKQVIYKNYVVSYMLSSDVITIYSDEERKKENRSIIIWTKIKNADTVDVLDEFCTDCIKRYIEHLKSQNWVPQIHYNKNGSWVPKPLKNKRKIDTIILPHQMKRTIMKDLTFFLERKDWFDSMGVPYTRGYLFYGKPGTGKTSLIKGISNYCKRDIHYLILNEIRNDEELFSLLEKIDYSTTILVIEDIDCSSEITKKRDQSTHNLRESNRLMNLSNDSTELMDQSVYFGQLNNFQSVPNMNRFQPIPNITISLPDMSNINKNQNNLKNDKGITLSGLLNAIDGINECDGRILIMTSNKPEILDDALIRVGRIDQKFNFDYCTHEQISDMYRMFFGKDCDDKVIKTIDEKRYSPAHLSSLFIKYLDNPDDALLNVDSIDDFPL